VFGVLTCDTMEQVRAGQAAVWCIPCFCAVIIQCCVPGQSLHHTCMLTQSACINHKQKYSQSIARQRDKATSSQCVPFHERYICMCPPPPTHPPTHTGAGPCWRQGWQQGRGGSHHCHRDGKLDELTESRRTGGSSMGASQVIPLY
jgi:hypothetical protein